MRYLLKARVIVLAAIAYFAVGIVAPTPAPGLHVGDPTNLVKVAANVDASSTQTIRCPWSIGYPHNSSHVLGTVNSQVKAQCTQPVTRIELRVQLWYREASASNIIAATPRMVADSGWSSGWNRADWRTNAAKSCVPGEYQARGWINVTFPPGYVPIIPSSSGSTPWRLVDCVLADSEIETFPVAPS